MTDMRLPDFLLQVAKNAPDKDATIHLAWIAGWISKAQAIEENRKREQASDEFDAELEHLAEWGM